MEFEGKEKVDTFEVVRIPEDIYNATFSGIEKISDGQYGERVALHFLVSPPIDKMLSTVCYTQVTPTTRLGKIFSAMGINIIGKFNSDEYVGTPVRIIVKDFATKDKDGKPIIRSTISDVMKHPSMQVQVDEKEKEPIPLDEIK